MEIVIIASLVLGILLLNRPVTVIVQRLYTRQQFSKFIARETFYHSIVSRYFKYYNRLGLDEQRKFLFRTYQFQQSKHFHYIEVEATAEMPILVSAAAVQLTFGLEKFKLSYFDDIFILRDDYHYGFYSRPFMGHVDQTGIYLSWDNFIKGISGQTFIVPGGASAKGFPRANRLELARDEVRHVVPVAVFMPSRPTRAWPDHWGDRRALRCRPWLPNRGE